MNDSLTLYRDQLRDAIDRDVLRRRTAARRRVAIGVPAAAATATAAALLISTGSPSGTSPADAAILRGVAAELAPPAGTILHEQAMVSDQGAPAVPYELWQQADTPQSYRIIKFGSDGEYDGATGHFLLYNPGSNTITSAPVAATPGRNGRGAEDFAATLRAMVQQGQATVDSTTTYDGIREYDRESGVYIPSEELKREDYAAWQSVVDREQGRHGFSSMIKRLFQPATA